VTLLVTKLQRRKEDEEEDGTAYKFRKNFMIAAGAIPFRRPERGLHTPKHKIYYYGNYIQCKYDIQSRELQFRKKVIFY